MWRKKPGTDVIESSSTFPYELSDPSESFLLYFIILLIVSFIFASSIFSSVMASKGTEMEESITENGIPEELVAGFFNEINYESSNTETSIELLYNGSSRYIWEFDGEWTGDLDYLDENGTYYDEQESSWIVSIAIDHEAPTGDDWTLILDGKENDIQVVEADTTVGLSGSLEFDFEPYTEGGEVSDSVTLMNDGNVPMTYELTYSDENLIHEAEKDILEAGESISLNFTYQYSTSGPEMFSPEVSLTAKYLGFLDFKSEGNIGRRSQSGFGLTANVLVGYEDYEQENIESYSVQYKRSISLEGNTYNQVTFYLYPNEEVSINFNDENVTFEDENVTITARNSDGEEIEDIDFGQNERISSGYEEVEITVEFKSNRQNDGYIELLVEGDRYTTEVQLSEKAPEPGNEKVSFVEEESETITLGVFLIGGVVVFGAARIWLGKKEEGED